jgi:ribosome-binding protein aMBF1 (putative translation factor)
MEHQDWQTVTVRRSAPKNANEAKARGLVEQRVRDHDSATHQHIRALAESDEPPKPKYLPSDSRKALTTARLAKKLTQDQTDALCAFPKHTIKGLEAGSLIPNHNHFRVISRELGVNLKIN